MRFILLALMLAATPAVADVPAADVKVSETGFVVENRAVASAAPDAVWAALVAPARYWNPDHS